ncbi:MAG: hypothetical protein WAY93_09480 [Atopobiaceae bacterium]|jgi:hypothetical protein
MPSWNIHTAHVERLLREEEPSRLGVRDVNCFLFGNFLPDVYVGYMVKPTTTTYAYSQTHWTPAHPIPSPHADEFWERYVAGGQASDVTLGAWAHLLCDSIYNSAVRDYNDLHGVAPGERTRIRKQADFDRFGRTLPISLEVRPTERLVGECEAFPQYPVLEPDVRAACEVADRIVRDNGARELEPDPEYSLLTQDFFLETFERVNERMLLRLRAYGRRRHSS